MPGGVQMGAPSYSDAIPPKPARQGDPGPVHYVDEHTFESGSVPSNTGAIESSWTPLIDSDGLDGASMDADRVSNKGVGEGIRGFRTTPVGGTYNPGQAGR
jgi:hypothetical protein